MSGKLKRKTDTAINRELEAAKLGDFDVDKAVFVNERWNLTKSYPLNIRLQNGVLAEAKAIAKEKGIPYQTLLKLYISEGVRKDKRAYLGA